MKRTSFDNLFIGFLLIMISAFIVLITYSTYATRNTLIEERQKVLVNEATLISQETIASYVKGTTSKEILNQRFDSFEDSLQVKVWYTDKYGNIIAASHFDDYKDLTTNIFMLDNGTTLRKAFTLTGTFYDVFDEDMVSIGVPIENNDKLQGYLILHSPIKELNSIKTNFFSITYMPFLLLVLVSSILLAYLSSKVLKPLSKIAQTAKEYAHGNFDAKIGIKNTHDEIGELASSMEYMAGELNKLDEYRKNFIANISHDFRSPLTSIKGYLEAMLDGTIPPEMHEKYLKIVLSESNRLTKLTSSLLELNNFDTAGPILKKSSFDIMDIANSINNTFEGRFQAKKIEFKVICSSKESIAYADKTKIQQVIYNLVDNAIKFSPKNSTITLEISEKNEKIFVSVKDQGSGIEKEDQNKIWDRFYKTDPSRGKDKQGTGLGLSITKEIIKAHGEHINVISTAGVGSEFLFSLPKRNKDK